MITNIGINFAGGGGGGSDAKLESKDYSLTANGSTTIRPSSGYDGISGGTIQVNVDMQPAYNSGYTEGYASGYTSGETDGYSTGYASGYTSGETDGYATGYASGETVGYASGETAGAAAQKALLTSTTITENGSYTRENGWNAITVDVPPVGGNRLNQYFNNQISSITQSDLSGMTSTPMNAFKDKTNLVSVDLPSSVTSLNSSSFENTRITSIDLKNVTLLGSSCFKNCYNLTGITGFENYQNTNTESLLENCYSLSGNLNTRIYCEDVSYTYFNKTFAGCTGLTSITFLRNVPKLLGSYSWAAPFTNCISIEYLDLTHNNRVATIDVTDGFTAFTQNYEIRVPEILYDEWTAATNWSNSNIVDHIVAYPNPYPTYTTIKYHTSNGSALTADYESPDWIGWSNNPYGFLVSNEFDAVTGGTVSYYGEIGTQGRAFSASTVTDIEFNSFYRMINYLVCNNCNELTSVTLNNCYKIGNKDDYADGPFSNCSALTNVYISGDVDYLYNAFMRDSALNSITINCTTPPELAGNTFLNCPATGTLYVPSELISVYTNWIVGTRLSGWTVTAITA